MHIQVVGQKYGLVGYRVTGKGYMDVNRISGYIPGKIVFFLMQASGLRYNTTSYRSCKCCTQMSRIAEPPRVFASSWLHTILVSRRPHLPALPRNPSLQGVLPMEVSDMK